MQNTETNHLLSMFSAIYGSARHHGPHACGNPSGIAAVRDFHQHFWNDINGKPLANSQPQIQILARRQALVEPIECLEYASPDHPERRLTDDVDSQQFSHEIRA